MFGTRFNFIYLPKDALEKHKDSKGNTGYHLIMTIEGENAENAYPVLTSTYGFLSKEEYEEYKAEGNGSASVITSESYLIDAQPGKAVFAIPIRIDSYGAYGINFDWDAEVLGFDSGTSTHTFTLDGSAGEGRNYTVSFTDGADTTNSTSVNHLDKVFFEVTPPDNDHAWAVMVIPDKYVKAEENSGVNIDTSWGRETMINFTNGHRYYQNSLFKNSAGKFTATYLTDDMTAVISEITLKADEPSVKTDLNGTAELSVTADYQYEKLYGMTDVTYQWYQCDDANGTNPQKIDGATSATYTPPTDTAGTYYYYVTAKFEQFTESTGYKDMDGNPLYFCDPYGWASDTVTTSEVMTLTVGEQSAVEVQKPEQETDGFVYGGEVAFLHFVVKVDDAPASSEKGTVTISLVDGENLTEIYEKTDVELNETIVFTYDTLEKGLKIGDNTIRITYTSNDVEIIDSSKDLTITLKPKEVQAVVTDTNITKVYDGTNKATVTLTLNETDILNGDDVTVSAPNATYDNASVGDNKTITLGELKLEGEDAEWYKVVPPDETITGSITRADQGTLTISGLPETVYSGDTFQLTATGGTGDGAVTWEVSGPATVDANGNVTVTGAGEIVIQATKTVDGYHDATAQITFTASNRIPPANPNYKITIEDTENGTVTAPTSAKQGTEVTLTPTPDEGFEVADVTVTDRFGDAVEVTENPDGTYTFTMPNGQVTVEVTFVESQPEPLPFTDVAESDWFYDAVRYDYENGLMGGVGDNLFAPNNPTTRAQLVTILYRLEGEPEVSGQSGFTDVEADTWYTDAVTWAAEEGVVNGVSETQFAPGNNITREQLATILFRYAQAKGYDVSARADLSGFPDAGDIQSYATEGLSWAVAEGLLQGFEDDSLRPQSTATRAQIATILMRFCEGVAK